MAFLPLDTVKLFVDLFDVIYLRGHKVKEVKFNPNGLQKIYIVDGELVLLVRILKNKSVMPLNAQELFQKAHGRGNRFVHTPSESEIYYQLEIQELTPNTVGFQFIKDEFIDRLEMLTGIDFLGLDVDYIRFNGWRRPYWDKEKELLIERVDRLRPELKLKERFEKWEGYAYHFAIIKLPRRGRPEYAVAYFKSDPNDYLKRFVDRYEKTGTISGEIRGERGFMNNYRAFAKTKRLKNLSKMMLIVKTRYFREKDDVWRYADNLLLKARADKFDNYKPLLSMIERTKMPEEDIDLDRFIQAQDFGFFDKDGKVKDTNYQRALREMKKGQKESHWMWYVFPQLKGLGWSEYANKYGIHSIHEAIAYYEHPILGKRLEEITKAVLKQNCDIDVIFGDVDAMKFHSCMTLFLEVDPNNKVFLAAIEKFFYGDRDQMTLRILQQQNPDEDPDEKPDEGRLE